MLRKFFVPVLAAALAGAVTTGISVASSWHDQHGANAKGSRAYAIGLWGDLPYSNVQATTGVPNLIADMNSAESRVHGARRRSQAAGSSECTDAVYTQALALPQQPARAGHVHAGRQRLDRLRPHRNGGFRRSSGSITSGGASSGRRTPSASTASRRRCRPTPLCSGVTGPVPCVENRRWTRRRRHLRDDQHPGLLQQPVRHGARPGRVRRAQRREHRLAAGDLRRREGAPLGRGHAHHAGRSRAADLHRRARALRCAIRRRSPRPTASPTASRTSWSRCATGSSTSGVRSPTSTATRTTSASTSRSSTRRASGSRTSRGSRRSATTRRTATTTCTGSRCWSTRPAARSSRTSRRSCRPTAPRFPHPE